MPHDNSDRPKLTPAKCRGAVVQIAGCWTAHSQYNRPGSKRWHKKRSNRLMRRWAKFDPEHAPQKYPFCDYWD